jgi:hypothetical protein
MPGFMESSPETSKSKLKLGIRFAYLLPALHLCFLAAVCVTDAQSVIPRMGIADFPVTLLASPVLMNVDVSVVWVVLYFAVCGSLWWYLLGRFLDRFVGLAKC